MADNDNKQMIDDGENAPKSADSEKSAGKSADEPARVTLSFNYASIRNSSDGAEKVMEEEQRTFKSTYTFQDYRTLYTVFAKVSKCFSKFDKKLYQVQDFSAGCLN